MFRLSLRRRIVRRIAILRRRIRAFWNGVLGCALSRCRRYRQLESTGKSSPIAMARHDDKESSDLVGLKMSVLGDSQVGKTRFVMKYVGRERESEEEGDMNEMGKTLCIRGVRIAYSIWEVGGARDQNHVLPAACKDSVAILIMFDLTSRSTLNSVIQWYQEARKWNQVAIPVLIGTKFDDFVKLPMDLQWTIASQARAYAKALNATLFFSSATYNINVTKIFKFITAKLFNLPWNLQRNLTIGEPIIDY